MAVAAIKRFSFSWTTTLAAMSFLAAAWAAVQVGFLISALTQGPPSPDSRLVFEHHNTSFFYSLVFHAGAIVLFGALALLAGNAGRQVDLMRLGKRRNAIQFSYAMAFLLPAFALYMVFQFSVDNPRYQIYVEDSLQEIIRIETRLMPQGTTEVAIAYEDVRVISGKMDYSSWWGDRYYLSVVTMDWDTMVIAQGGRDENPELLYSLARNVAASAGVEADLGSKLPQFR